LSFGQNDGQTVHGKHAIKFEDFFEVPRVWNLKGIFGFKLFEFEAE